MVSLILSHFVIIARSPAILEMDVISCMVIQMSGSKGSSIPITLDRVSKTGHISRTGHIGRTGHISLLLQVNYQAQLHKLSRNSSQSSFSLTKM
jgi:hypothetical protein